MFFGFPLSGTNDGLSCGKAQSLIGEILLPVLQSSCLVFLGKMTMAKYEPCQDQLSVTLKVDFIYTLCARVDVESSSVTTSLPLSREPSICQVFSSVMVERTCVICTALLRFHE